MQSIEHKAHIKENVSHNNCPECRADNSRWHAMRQPFRYQFVREYLTWAKPRIEAIRAGENSDNARRWQRDFVSALHNRISSHIRATGRKHAPDYAKYHLATHGNDYRFIHNL